MGTTGGGGERQGGGMVVGPKMAIFLTKIRKFLEYHGFPWNRAYTIGKWVKMRYFYVPDHFSMIPQHFRDFSKIAIFGT